MTISHKGLPPIPEVYGGNNARRHGRVQCRLVACSTGEVMDLSASGARLRWDRPFRGHIGDRIRFEISGVDRPVQVTARIVWARKVGWRRYVMGVEFQNLSPDDRAQLTLVARRMPTVYSTGPDGLSYLSR